MSLSPQTDPALVTPSPWRKAVQHPLFSVLAVVVGVALMFGAPLLAGGHDDHGHDDAGHDAHATGGHDHAADAHVGDDHHGDGHHEEGTVHPPTLVTILATLVEGKEIHGPADADNGFARFLLTFNAPIYSALVILILCSLCIAGARSMTLIPGKLQNAVEMALEGLANFIEGVVGVEGRRYVPFLGTLFLYIYFQNIFGLFPLMFTPTSVLSTTAALAVVVFFYVQFEGLRTNGVVGYLRHLAGDPKDAVSWGMAPLMFPLHIVGELAKPLSLSLRLFGNMMGEETLIAVFMGLGVTILAFTHLPIGLPLQLPFLFLGLLTTLIQAVVFTLLSAIYFALVLPHHEEGHH